MDNFIVVLGIFNMAVFIIYGMDKWFAMKHKRRISEKTLMTLAGFGPFGAVIGIYLWRHKIRKWYFPTFSIIMCFIHGVIVWYIKSNLYLR